MIPRNNIQPHAVVTGATRGIGNALTKELLESGWTVFGTGRDEGALQDLRNKYPNFVPVVADFKDPINAAQQVVTTVTNNLKENGTKLQVLVNNAAMLLPPQYLFKNSPEDIAAVMNVNTTVPTILIAQFIANKIMDNNSRIVTVSSRAVEAQLSQFATYSASKAAIEVILNTTKKDLAENAEQNIDIVTVIPGEVDTDMQGDIRKSEEFLLLKNFQDAHQNKKLIDPNTCSHFKPNNAYFHL
jgi:benzil reductase ((S)-benzoin forming)